MMPWWAMALLIFGLNFTVWGLVGLCRWLDLGVVRRRHRKAGHRPAELEEGHQHGDSQPGQASDRRRKRARPKSDLQRRGGFTVKDVAVLIPAHNEAEVIAESLAAIMDLIPSWNVHVVSDASTDTTVAIARSAGAKVYQTDENLGKAGALQDALRRFRIIERFPVVMLLDADTRVDPGYFAAALPLFDDPEVVAVAGCVRTAADRAFSFMGQLLIGHRRRIYAIGQRVLKYGQTWQRFNATHIVPGFASLYRTSVLPHIDMNPPGLVIEDFNMTFEVYQKRLGKVGFTLSAVAITQDPDNFRDYVKQTKRWALGFWQTVRRHRPQANLFSAMLSVLMLELVTSSVVFLVLPLVVAILVMPELFAGAPSWPVFGPVYTATAAHMTLSVILFGVFIPDLIITVIVVVLERKPSMLLFAGFFPLLRVVDATLGLYALMLTFRSRSNGRWKSPARQVSPAALEPLVPLPPEMAATQLMPQLRITPDNPPGSDTQKPATELIPRLRVTSADVSGSDTREAPTQVIPPLPTASENASGPDTQEPPTQLLPLLRMASENASGPDTQETVSLQYAGDSSDAS
jgi:poly-beta-1,6-N-acetyl-D-glucosamine synthase